MIFRSLFLIWNNRFEAKENIQHIPINMDENINSQWNLHPKKIPFLTICIYIENTEIKTDISQKDTDTFNYLDFRSCHPHHCKENIPFNMARHICTIASDHSIKE